MLYIAFCSLRYRRIGSTALYYHQINRKDERNMKRNIISINEEKCTGCGLCAEACHEGAIQMVDGKAKLVSESYCDGLGACLPVCPADAIHIEQREAAAFDAEAAKHNMDAGKSPEIHGTLACGCPGTHARTLERSPAASMGNPPERRDAPSELRQWPCQIQLVPPNAPYLKNAHLLIAADCTAFANANVHSKWMRGRVTLIGCPKLDDVDYSEKLEAILRANDIQSLTILRISVPCCGGIVSAAKQAMTHAGVMIPWQAVTIEPNGDIKEQ
jgi:ferredoxin